MKRSLKALIFAFTGCLTLSLCASLTLADDSKKKDSMTFAGDKCETTVSYDSHLFRVETPFPNLDDEQSKLNHDASVLAEACNQACLHLSGNPAQNCIAACKQSAKSIKTTCSTNKPKKHNKSVNDNMLFCRSTLSYHDSIYEFQRMVNPERNISPEENLLKMGCSQVCRNEVDNSDIPLEQLDSYEKQQRIDNHRKCAEDCISSASLLSVECLKGSKPETPQYNQNCSARFTYNNNTQQLNLSIPDSPNNAADLFLQKACNNDCAPLPAEQESACVSSCIITSLVDNLRCQSENPNLTNKIIPIRDTSQEAMICSSVVSYNNKAYPVTHGAFFNKLNNDDKKPFSIENIIRSKSLNNVCGQVCAALPNLEEMACKQSCRSEAAVYKIECVKKFK